LRLHRKLQRPTTSALRFPRHRIRPALISYTISLPGGTTGGNEFPDYPHLGVWPDGYYMMVHQFTLADLSMARVRTRLIAPRCWQVTQRELHLFQSEFS
jgi:hypothetical protein